MKKIFGLLMASALIVSCSDDDNNGPSVDMSKLSQGKWYYSKSVVNGVDMAYEHECATKKDYVEFAATGGVVHDVYFDADCVLDSDAGSYTVNGNVITTDYFGYVETATVKELTSSQLVLEVGYDSNDDGTNDVTGLVVLTAN